MAVSCAAPQRANTVGLRLAVLRFAVRRGVGGVASRRAVRIVAAAWLAVMVAVGVWGSWGRPWAITFSVVAPILLLAAAPVAVVAAIALVSESWYYAPEPGKRAMPMMWPTYRPGVRIAGNFVAEPQRQGLGEPLARAWMQSCQYRHLTVRIAAANPELATVYRRWGFSDRPGRGRGVPLELRPAAGTTGGSGV